MTAEHYGENHLYTIASQLSRAVEEDTQEGSITYCISKVFVNYTTMEYATQM